MLQFLVVFFAGMALGVCAMCILFLCCRRADEDCQKAEAGEERGTVPDHC